MPFWESSAFWGIVGVVGVLLGILSSAGISYYWANRKVLEHSIHPSELITKDISNIPGLAVTIYGQSIQDLTATKVRFFNAGNQTLKPSNFAKTEQLGVSISGFCFGAQVKSDNPNAEPGINPVDEHTLDVEFEFLDPKESLTLIVWHDGVVSFHGNLISGKVRESKEKKSYDLPFFTSALIFLVFAFGAVLTLAISLIWGSPIVSFDEFISSSFLPLSFAISYSLILIPIFIYSFTRFLNRSN